MQAPTSNVWICLKIIYSAQFSIVAIFVGGIPGSRWKSGK